MDKVKTRKQGNAVMVTIAQKFTTTGSELDD